MARGMPRALVYGARAAAAQWVPSRLPRPHEGLAWPIYNYIYILYYSINWHGGGPTSRGGSIGVGRTTVRHGSGWFG